jgi:hypothetical protein
MKIGSTLIGCMLITGVTRGTQSVPNGVSPVQMQINAWIEEGRKFPNSDRAATQSGRQSGLIDLLDRGYRLMEAILRESNSTMGVGEEFRGVYDDLFAWLWQMGDREDQRVLDVLAKGSYNEDSPFALEIAEKYGERIAPAVLEKTHSDVTMSRATATRMLGTILLKSQRLQSGTSDAMRAAIINAATSDPDLEVRQSAVMAIGRVGTAPDLTLLQQISGNDSGVLNDWGAVRYPVREAAQRAVAEIQKR